MTTTSLKCTANFSEDDDKNNGVKAEEERKIQASMNVDQTSKSRLDHLKNSYGEGDGPIEQNALYMACHGEEDTEEEEEEEATLLNPTMSSSLTPPHKKLRKAVSWDGLDPYRNNDNDFSRPRIVSILNKNSNNGSNSSLLVDWLETTAETAVDRATSVTTSEHNKSLTYGDYNCKESLWSTDSADTTDDTCANDINSDNYFRNDDDEVSNFHGEVDFSKWKVGQKYKMLRIIGRGSYGEVAQARNMCSPGEFVAIKRILSAFRKEEDALRKFHINHLISIRFYRVY